MSFKEGDEVRILFDIVSDGTVAGAKRGELIMAQGSTGFIKKIGVFMDDYVFDVHFLKEDKIVGCRENELISADEAWSPPKFKKKDSILAAANIGKNREVLIPAKTAGKVLTIDYHDDLGYIYEVEFENDIKTMMGENQIELSQIDNAQA